ncbi:hypothetical protein EJ08DRAFT_668011 [Tothia fuscella]|uniref:t-SNARE coiled-coil homology domain-containing protein n=1 Tax=Tothia fuscella TaxID=1048955 RepID=A0A9P4NYU5_9PEZI|nr:hypothetical protein EJ08DRAFT_668011 [Tothia fuscella]
MASRYNSNLHQRESRSSLFANYDARPASQSPSKGRPGSGYSQRYGAEPSPNSQYSCQQPSSSSGGGFSAYPNNPSSSADSPQQFRTATPNSRGQYSDAVLSELESQNDSQISGILGKVGKLKELTLAIGDEIRDSTALAEKMNDGFDGTRMRLRGTMKRMVRMAESTGVGWRVWVGFFAAVMVLFCYVWLF